jgi:hypothetical protein
MQPTGTAKAKSAKRSLTDRILALCASGRFGVREAITAALQKSANGESSQPDPQVEKTAETRLPLLPEQSD